MQTDSARQKLVAMVVGDFKGGLNSTASPVAIKKDQFQAGLNCLVDDAGGGFIRSPGFYGLSTSAQFTDYIRGLFHYRLYDATESLIAVSGGKLKSVSITDGTLTDLFTIGSDSSQEAWATTMYNKLFVANGVDVVKLETSTAYKLGIAAPTGVSVAAAAGGSLTAGVYQVYACYARKVSSSNVLYSKGQSLGSVTLSASDLSVAISGFTNSTDPQVNNKCIFMTDAGGSVAYFYYETDNNTTTSFTITSASARNASIGYDQYAGSNDRPGALQWIAQFGDRLIGGIDNTVYYSINGTTVYDLEKWPASYFRSYPHKVTYGFELDGNLYLNSTHGIYRQPNGDFSGKYDHVEKRLYFKYPRTIQVHNGVAWGLTNDGFRFFDGTKFSPDLSVDVKVEIDKVYTWAGDNFQPCGVVFNRSGVRSEYQLSYRDSTISGNCNNRTLVLNLDRVQIVSAADVIAPWELWESGYNYAAVFEGNQIYKAQHISDSGTIYKELTNYSTVADQYIFDPEGTFLTSATNKECTITTRIEIPEIMGICTWGPAYVLAKITKDCQMTITIDDVFNLSGSGTIDYTAENQFILDVNLLDVDLVSNPAPDVYRVPFKRNLSGRMISVKFSQTADDPDMQIYSAKIPGNIETGAHK